MGATLTIDIGNTSLKWGVWESGTLVERGATPHRATVSEIPEPWRKATRVGVASVARTISDRFSETWSSELPPLERFTDYRDLPVELSTAISDPGGVGVDRLLNVLAWGSAHPGEAAILVDFGTAITLDLSTAEGVFAGGQILPGAELLARALGANTALLPEVAIEPGGEVIGTDTESAIVSGVSGLILGGVERQIADLLRVFDRNARVVATGGGAALWTPHLPSIERIIPDLTLRGIVRALEAREEA